MINILLVDDHQMIRQGLKLLLDAQSDMQVVAEAENGRDAVEAADRFQPDVVVMDLNLPEMNGVEATRQILAARAQTLVVCLSANSSQRPVVEMLRAGATGFVVKESAFDELAVAIRSVKRGRAYLSQSIAGTVITDVMNLSGTRVHTSGGNLSPREREVLQLISEGHSTKRIAMQLQVSQKTVETHRRNLMLKVNVDSIAELTKFAVREGITTL